MLDPIKIAFSPAWWSPGKGRSPHLRRLDQGKSAFLRLWRWNVLPAAILMMRVELGMLTTQRGLQYADAPHSFERGRNVPRYSPEQWAITDAALGQAG
jgi:hypothetical protein